MQIQFLVMHHIIPEACSRLVLSFLHSRFTAIFQDIPTSPWVLPGCLDLNCCRTLSFRISHATLQNSGGGGMYRCRHGSATTCMFPLVEAGKACGKAFV